ncbi:hypothetical protein F383_10725 [Gossypium arboreum]|uniref:Uncharacterized protein n=1 Tax=Gossypium arboreum TaxID=29729 RepID=A0A0B0NYI7_GOSAR|nr:hypothetical protein F383_10725 [Gossypium arboreum]
MNSDLSTSSNVTCIASIVNSDHSTSLDACLHNELRPLNELGCYIYHELGPLNKFGFSHISRTRTTQRAQIS